MGKLNIEDIDQPNVNLEELTKPLKMNQIPKRPTWNDEMQYELDSNIAKKIFEWSDQETPIKQILEDLKHVSIYSNSYEQAKEFDRIGYCPDLELIEIFEDRIGGIYSIKNEFIKKWVSDNNLQINLKINQKVLYNKEEFIITGFFEATYQAKIWNKTLPYSKKQGARIVNIEEIQLI